MKYAWIAWTMIAALGSGCPGPLPEETPLPGDGPLADMLAPIVAEYPVPGLAAMVLGPDAVGAEDVGIIAHGVVGFRRAGDPTPMEMTDQFHIGSNTKAMTATLLAMLVDEAALDWDTSLAEVFPEFTLHPDYQAVTLAHLLHHRAGIDDQVVTENIADTYPDLAPVVEQRAFVAEFVLGAPATLEPGSEYRYANANYVIVGAALERATGTPWEELMQTRLFEPLGMDSCGFGAPGQPGMVAQPWGHVGAIPIEPGPGADNPPVYGPAGTVHCSLEDWSKFALEHLAGARGADGLVSQARFARMHTPWPDDIYAFGWLVVDDPDKGLVLTHDGSNTLWYARIGIFPETNQIVLVATNRGDATAVNAVNAATQALLETY